MGKPGRPSPSLDEYLYCQQRLENHKASGLSIDEFCADEGVSRSTFYRWIQRLRDGIPDSVAAEGVGPTSAEMAQVARRHRSEEWTPPKAVSPCRLIGSVKFFS